MRPKICTFKYKGFFFFPQLGLSSFHQQAIHFLCGDVTRACQVWGAFSTLSPDLRLSLVSWLVDGCGWQQSSLPEVIQRVLRVRHDLLSRLERKEKKLF